MEDADAQPGSCSDHARTPRNAALDRIPLVLRMAAYGLSFLAFMLVVLPWGASRLDVYVPSMHMALPIGVRVAGWVLFAVFFGIYVGSSFVLTHKGRGAYVEFDPPRAFVASGPFRWCRNPIAGCVAMMLLSLGLALSSTGVLILFALGLPLAHAQVVLLEEPLLRQRFGQPYEDYLRTVPRWMPRRPRRAES